MTTKLTTDPVKEINRLHREIAEAFQSSIGRAIRIGELLTEQKKALKHGEFLPWIEQNLPFTPKAAQNYMRVYAHREEVQALPDTTSAYRLLGMRKKEPPTEGSQSSRNAGSEKSNASLGTHLDPATPRNDSEEGSKPEIVTTGEPSPEEDPDDPFDELEDSGPPIDLSDPIFEEGEKEGDPELLPGRTPKEVIALSGLPKPLNWKGDVPQPKLPPEEPLKVLVIKMTGEDAGEVIEVAEGTIWDVMKRYEMRDGLRFACGVGVRKGQKVGHIWEDEPEEAEPDPLRAKRDALPVSWVETLYEIQELGGAEARILNGLRHMLSKIKTEA